MLFILDAKTGRLQMKVILYSERFYILVVQDHSFDFYSGPFIDISS